MSLYSMNPTAPTDSNMSLNGSVTTTYNRPFGEITIWVSCVIIFSLFVIGFTLNLITVLVIVKFPQLRNFFVVFILSLCISDLISAFISPLFWYRRTFGFEDWMLPDFLCRFYWGADYMTSFATALHVSAFGLLRYFTIKFPFYSHKMTLGVAKIFIISIWFVSFCCAFVPFAIWFGSRERHRHDHNPESRWPSCTINMEWYSSYKLFQKIAYPLFIYGPTVIMTVTSILTSIEVAKSTRMVPAKASNRRRKKDKQAVLQLVLIVISFLIGYLPFSVYEYWSTQEYPENTEDLRRLDYHLGLSQYFFIRFSECLNPIFYNLGSSRMRRCTRSYCRQLCGKKDVRRRSITVISDFGRTVSNSYVQSRRTHA